VDDAGRKPSKNPEDCCKAGWKEQRDDSEAEQEAIWVLAIGKELRGTGTLNVPLNQ
jgi:hypothetical protein